MRLDDRPGSPSLVNGWFTTSWEKGHLLSSAVAHFGPCISRPEFHALGGTSRGHWSLVTLFTVSTFWSKKDRVTSDQVCLESHTCHTKMVRPLCGRLWPYSCPKYHFWRKSRRKASFLSFAASFLKEVSQKSFVLELRSFIFEGSFAEKLGFWVWKLQFWMKSRRKASF